jgi:PiT family inorganic phosphate transporter
MWGTTFTVAGALVAMVATQALVAAFSGKGILRNPVAAPSFAFAVACGAIGWLLIATRTGLPVSTTHALTGALCGAGIAASGFDGVAWNTVAARVALPLAVSPLASLAIVLVVYPLTRKLLTTKNEPLCVCVASEALVAVDGALTARDALALQIAPPADCERSSSTAVARVKPIDAAHWLTAGATSFFRGMNDTPKILAIGVGAATAGGLATKPLYALVALAMGAGSLLWGFRVTETLACKVTTIEPVDGFAANSVTSVLVGLASFYALPVSTTHVSSGAILGIGLAKGRRNVHWTTLGEMLLAWIVTLPVAAVIGAIVFRLMT